MTRISKKDRLKKCPRKPRIGGQKTGTKRDNLSKGFKEHTNAVDSNSSSLIFIPSVKQVTSKN